mmetsp:Transcript_61818/g.133972  ORF Transcript_61818/g.133972 Transcript_61818/m.133972 type:complete len:216 (-) Transcript_61818:49-696(-)
MLSRLSSQHSVFVALLQKVLLFFVWFVDIDALVPAAWKSLRQASSVLADEGALLPPQLPPKDLERLVMDLYSHEGFQHGLVWDQDACLLHLKHLVIPGADLPQAIRLPLVQLVPLIIRLTILHYILHLELHAEVLILIRSLVGVFFELLHLHYHLWSATRPMDISEPVKGEVQHGLPQLGKVTTVVVLFVSDAILASWPHRLALHLRIVARLVVD